ncbi:hypothetical protein IAR55_001358 [Kwoniella newhampshirensis]|uniref:Phytanoyl-CoA dioxygenase n=1 Tax=Kwoniella newhampshirensis TaxID=1651941 RepID=A0AAW0Z1Z0_9TREE
MVAAQWVLSDFSADNGATEVWPGSHLFADADEHVWDPEMQMWIKDELVKGRAQTRPPLQVECKAGGVYLRDMRLWHAGMPNKSDEDRIMLACGYTARWYNCVGRVTLPKGVEHLYESTPEVEVMADFVPLEDFLAVRHKIDRLYNRTGLDVPGGLAAESKSGSDPNGQHPSSDSNGLVQKM